MRKEGLENLIITGHIEGKEAERTVSKLKCLYERIGKNRQIDGKESKVT